MSKQTVVCSPDSRFGINSTALPGCATPALKTFLNYVFEFIKMFPITHFLSSIVLLVLLYPFYGFLSLAVFIGGFFIDFDHYLFYAFQNRELNIIKCYNNLTREAIKNRIKCSKMKKPVYLSWDKLHIFHVWEFWLIIILLTFVHKLFFIILLGMVIHLTLDFIDLFMHRVYGERAMSLIRWLIRHSRKRLG